MWFFFSKFCFVLSACVWRKRANNQEKPLNIFRVLCASRICFVHESMCEREEREKEPKSIRDNDWDLYGPRRFEEKNIKKHQIIAFWRCKKKKTLKTSRKSVQEKKLKQNLNIQRDWRMIS